jgi:hypothetical protein
MATQLDAKPKPFVDYLGDGDDADDLDIKYPYPPKKILRRLNATRPHQDYPKYMFHAQLPDVLVQDQEEADILLARGDWFEKKSESGCPETAPSAGANMLNTHGFDFEALKREHRIKKAKAARELADKELLDESEKEVSDNEKETLPTIKRKK